jgi:hypothetical protein
MISRDDFLNKFLFQPNYRESMGEAVMRKLADFNKAI